MCLKLFTKPSKFALPGFDEYFVNLCAEKLISTFLYKDKLMNQYNLCSKYLIPYTTYQVSHHWYIHHPW